MGRAESSQLNHESWITPIYLSIFREKSHGTSSATFTCIARRWCQNRVSIFVSRESSKSLDGWKLTQYPPLSGGNLPVAKTSPYSTGVWLLSKMKRCWERRGEKRTARKRHKRPSALANGFGPTGAGLFEPKPFWSEFVGSSAVKRLRRCRKCEKKEVYWQNHHWIHPNLLKIVFCCWINFWILYFGQCFVNKISILAQKSYQFFIC